MPEVERWPKENKPENVPYIVYEGEMARSERHIKRLWITVLVLIGLLVASNLAWIVYEAQFIDEVVTVESQTDGGGNAIANASGEVNFYGEGESDSTQAEP